MKTYYKYYKSNRYANVLDDELPVEQDIELDTSNMFIVNRNTNVVLGELHIIKHPTISYF